MLKNPVYVGRPAYGKTTQAAYQRITPDGSGYVDGVWKGDKEAYINLPPDQWVGADEAIEGIIDEETWQAVQVKLANEKPKTPNPPRSADLWLRQFLFCGTCGHRMRGWAPIKLPGSRSYACDTYIKYHGADNPPGCGKNRVLAAVVEEKLLGYLPDLDERMRKTLEDDNPRLGALMSTGLGHGHEMIVIVQGMLDFLKRFMTPQELDHAAPELEGLPELYDEFFARERAGIQDDLDILTTTLRKLMRSRLDLDPGSPSDRMALEDIKSTEREIMQLEVNLVPLTEQLWAVWDRVKQVHHDIDELRRVLRESSDRQKAEALARVLQRINLHFRQNPHATGNQYRSTLERIEFVDILGNSTTLELNATPELGTS